MFDTKPRFEKGLIVPILMVLALQLGGTFFGTIFTAGAIKFVKFPRDGAEAFVNWGWSLCLVVSLVWAGVAVAIGKQSKKWFILWILGGALLAFWIGFFAIRLGMPPLQRGPVLEESVQG